mmetsp:Transcript_99314/g.206875  ORF Transcript_99314/g.206875 Transcript_99314/m.206875 type:complete len:270 (-) Transcript_99314:243-1052(-)
MTTFPSFGRGRPKAPDILIQFKASLLQCTQNTRHLSVGVHARNVGEGARTAELAFVVDSVGEASEGAHVAGGIPLVGDCGFVHEEAGIVGDLDVVGAGDALEGSLAAEAALLMNAIGEAAQLAILAVGVPVVGRGGFVGEGASLRASDVRIRSITPAEAAAPGLVVCTAAKAGEVLILPLVVECAERFIVVGDVGGLIVELTLLLREPGLSLSHGAFDVVVVAEPALVVHSVREAAEHTESAVFLPIVRGVGRNDKLALLIWLVGNPGA